MTYQVQVTIPYSTNIPTDVVTNTLYFDWEGGGTPTDGPLSDIAFHLSEFYSDAYTTLATGGYAAYMQPEDATLKVYNLTDPKPRVPVAELPMNITGFHQDAATSIPPEVAIVLSFHGQYVSGENKASQRGRIYLGGLGNGFIQPATTSQELRVGGASRTKICSAATAMQASMSGSDWTWVVRSEKLAQSFDVVGGWVDDAPDTQRRRGQATTARTLFSI